MTMARVWKVNPNGKAPDEAQDGDLVVTAGGTYKVGDKDFYHPQINTYNYKGEYANPDMQALTDAAAKPLNQPAAPTVPAAVRQNTTPGLGANANAALAEYFNASRRRSGAGAYPGSEWDARTRQLINQALGMDYNAFTQGDAYKALAARYAQQGQQAMDETVSQIAARTGGLASSYAGVVGQQQYNEYMQRLEDAARQQFAQDRADAIQNAGLSQQMGAEAYQRWQDEQRRRASEDETQIAMIQQMMGNEESDYGRQLNEDEIAYRRGRDKIGDAERREQRDYERSESKRLEDKADKEKADATAKQDDATARKEARAEVDAIIGALGTPSAELIKASGYSPEYISTMMAAAKSAAEQKAKAGRGGGGGGNGRRTGGTFEEMYESMPENASLAEITQWLRDNGAKGNTSAYAKRYMEIQHDNAVDVVWAMRDAQEPIKEILRFINGVPNGTFSDKEKQALGKQVQFLYKKLGQRP